MKIITAVFASFIFSATLCAEEIRDVKSAITGVTVYLQGALIERNLNVQLAKGSTDLYVTGLSSKIDESSIRATAPDGVTILSVGYSVDYLSPQAVSDEIRTLSAQFHQIADSSAMSAKLNGVYQQEKEMILANKSIAGNGGVKADDLKATAIFFRERLTEIEMALLRDVQLQKRWMQRQQAIQRQLQTLDAQRNRPTGVVKLTVQADRATGAALAVSYVVNDARWMPAYDIRIADAVSPLHLFYKARISQSTEEDWRDVRLTLSTGNPAISNTKPDLQTYFITFNNYYDKPLLTRGTSAMIGTLSGRVMDSNGELLPGVNVMIKGTQTGTVTDVDGRYSLTLPPNAQTAVYSFIGYNTVEQPIASSVINVKLEEDAQMLEEVVVVGYGGVKGALAGMVPGMHTEGRSAPKKVEHVPLAIQQQQVSTEFRIDLPYTVMSDGQPRDVTMVEYVIPAEYRYSCVPKLSQDVFLIAHIPDVADYNLQSGEATLFYHGVYQGKTNIDAHAMSDTLSFSVGRDKDVAVERKLLRDYASRRTIGSNVREQRAWEITVKNNKTVPLRLTVEDQYPVSKESDIRIEDILHAGAKADLATGKLTWDMEIPPRGTEKMTVQYTVRYPKIRKVVVD